MNSKAEPQLAPPGAGLPVIELWIARRMFSRKLRSGDGEGRSAGFRAERAKIRRLVDGCAAERRGERVLIRRLPGLEDSSRHWSVWMTLDHLRITNEVFARVITSLDRGEVPEEMASTASVKPSPAVGRQVEASYERSCDEVLAAVAAAGDLKTAVKYAHPWFGPLDGEGWHALAAMHLGIHRKQIAKILEGLGN